MAELTTLARPYAKAAFESAEANDNLSQWSAMLEMSKCVAEDQTMQEFIQNPSLTAAKKADVFIDVCEGKLDDQGKNFIKVLAENQRLALIPEIVELYEQLKRLKEKTVDVEIISAFEVTGDQQQQLAKTLAAKLGRTVNMATTTDKHLIGGLIIRAEDQVIDASVRGKLIKLAETINS